MSSNNINVSVAAYDTVHRWLTNAQDSSAIQALLDQLKASDAWQKVASSDAAPATTGVSGGGPQEAVTAQRRTDAFASFSTDHESTSPHADHHGPSRDVPPTQPHAGSRELPGSEGSSNAPSVASLLSQLQASSNFRTLVGPSRTPAPTPTTSTHTPAYVPSASGGSRLPGPDAGDPVEAASASSTTPPSAPHTPRQDLRACTFQQALPHLARLFEDRAFVQALAAVRRASIDRCGPGGAFVLMRPHCRPDEDRTSRAGASAVA